MSLTKISFKISFNNEIHRTSSAISLPSLRQLVVKLFGNKLPQQWTLQYEDSQGDMIMLSHDQDFTDLVNELSSNGPSTKTTKIFVKPEEVQVQVQAQVNVKGRNPHPLVEEQKVQNNDDYELIESPVSTSAEQKNKKVQPQTEAKQEPKPSLTYGNSRKGFVNHKKDPYIPKSVRENPNAEAIQSQNVKNEPVKEPIFQRNTNKQIVDDVYSKNRGKNSRCDTSPAYIPNSAKGKRGKSEFGSRNSYGQQQSYNNGNKKNYDNYNNYNKQNGQQKVFERNSNGRGDHSPAFVSQNQQRPRDQSANRYDNRQTQQQSKPNNQNHYNDQPYIRQNSGTSSLQSNSSPIDNDANQFFTFGEAPNKPAKDASTPRSQHPHKQEASQNNAQNRGVRGQVSQQENLNFSFAEVQNAETGIANGPSGNQGTLQLEDIMRNYNDRRKPTDLQGILNNKDKVEQQSTAEKMKALEKERIDSQYSTVVKDKVEKMLLVVCDDREKLLKFVAAQPQNVTINDLIDLFFDA